MHSHVNANSMPTDFEMQPRGSLESLFRINNPTMKTIEQGVSYSLDAGVCSIHDHC